MVQAINNKRTKSRTVYHLYKLFLLYAPEMILYLLNISYLGKISIEKYLIFSGLILRSLLHNKLKKNLVFNTP